jgi:hypothetical protein
MTMTKRFVAVLEADGPGTSRPIFATADPETVTEVMRVIRDHLAPRAKCEGLASGAPAEAVSPE